MRRFLSTICATILLLTTACDDATGPGRRLPQLETIPWEALDNGGIAFTRLTSEVRSSGIFVLDGETRTGLVAEPLPNPAVSPDGSQLAYSRVISNPPGFQVLVLQTEHWAYSSQALATAEGFGGLPAWSPDGGLVYFHSFHQFEPHGVSIFRVPAVGGQPTRVWWSDDLDRAPHGRITVNADRTVVFAGLAGELLLLPTGDSVPDVIYTAPAGARLFSPQWSPDGTRIGFLELQQGQQGVTKRVRILTVADREVRTVTEVHGGDAGDLTANPLTHGLCWLSGQRLAFTHRLGSGTEAGQALHTVGAAGGATVQLTSPTGGARDTQLTCAPA